MGGDEARKKETDPDRPSARAMPSDDIPLIVKGSEEFPTRSRESWLSSQVKSRLAWWDMESHINTPSVSFRELPELHDPICSSDPSINRVAYP